MSPRLTLLGGLAALVALLRTDPSEVGDLGLVTALPVYGLAGFVLLALAALTAIFTLDFNEANAGWSVAAFVVTVSAAPALVYETARFSWAFKHVGIVDYITRTEGFEQTIEVLPVYHNWPGFFAGAASLTDWLGFEDAVAVAAWAPPVLNLITLASLVFLIGHFTTSRETVWLAVLLFFVTNWIGQDYFSPQAVAYILYLNVIALAMRFYRRLSPQRPTLAVHLVMVLLIFTIVATHQLTPLVLMVALFGLIVWRRTATVWVPLIAGIAAMVFWLGSWARSFVRENLSDELSGVGSPVANASETLAKASVRNDAQELVAFAGRGLIVGITLLAMIGMALRIWRGFSYRALLVLLAAPLVMMVLEFGGEILFRVALFMLPVLCLLAAETLRSLGPRLVQAVASAAVVLVCVTAFSLAYFGKDSFYSFTAAELDVVTELMASAPNNSLLVEGSRNYPSQFLEYEKFTYVAIDREREATQTRIGANPGDELFRWLSNARYDASYLILTQSQRLAASALGSLPPEYLGDIEAALRADDRFEVLIESDTAVVFVRWFHERPDRASPGRHPDVTGRVGRRVRSSVSDTRSGCPQLRSARTGLAVTRFVPTITGVDRLALAAAMSLALNIVASLLLVAVGEWSGEPVLATLGAIALGLAFTLEIRRGPDVANAPLSVAMKKFEFGGEPKSRRINKSFPRTRPNDRLA